MTTPTFTHLRIADELFSFGADFIRDVQHEAQMTPKQRAANLQAAIELENLTEAHPHPIRRINPHD